MYLRKIVRHKDGKSHGYWALVESFRTVRGPRQRIVAYLGEMDAGGRLGVHLAAEGADSHQLSLSDAVEPRWVEINVHGVRTERAREFGGVWLGLELLKHLALDSFFREVLPQGREQIPWAHMATILVLARLCAPSSELYVAEQFYPRSALPDLLGVPPHKVNDNRLYRALDQLLPHKESLEIHLKERMGGLFGLQYDLLLYDITSTYFEGQAEKNLQAKRGYSRDRRPDCKQVLIGLVVTREGVPLGYQVFDGNTRDVTTLQQMVDTMEARYGVADRIWVLDRGMMSKANLAFLAKPPRKYIVGTPRSLLKTFEKELGSADGWQIVPNGVEVKSSRLAASEETVILCRSAQRKVKEQAMQERFMDRIENGLANLQKACAEGRLKDASKAERRVGRLLGRNSRAAGLFDIQVGQAQNGTLHLTWRKRKELLARAEQMQGCYILRSNIAEWSAEELWFAYIQLWEAEAAFGIQKSDLGLRPIWHQKQQRVQAHILVCFLAYVLWKALAQMCKSKGLGNEPRKVFDEIRRLQLTDVVLPTRDGTQIKLRCVSKPETHQRILLQRLGFHPPSRLIQK